LYKVASEVTFVHYIPVAVCLRWLEVAARKTSGDEGKEIERELKIIHIWALYKLRKI
jgi:hypothetical protein